MAILQISSVEIRKIVVEIGCYLPQVYTCREESELQEIFSKKLLKSQFSIEISIKDFQIFLEKFEIFYIFGPNAQSFAGTLFNFNSPMEIIPQIVMFLHFSSNSIRFSRNSRIFTAFSIVLLYLSYFLAFLINLSST